MKQERRQEIEEALFDLLAVRKSLKAISITELSDHAQIARRTFYRYYNSKEEVIINYLNQLLHDYAEAAKNHASFTSFETFIAFFYHYWTSYADQLSILQEAGLTELLLQRSADLLAENYMLIDAAWHIDEKDRRQMAYDGYFVVGGFYNTLYQWLKTDAKYRPTVEELISLTSDTYKRLRR